MNNTIKRTERGWVGHFICAEKCRFRRNTLLELGRLRVIVSTVGDMHSNDAIQKILGVKAGDPEEIGYQRHYETMAFHAHKDGDYWDSDVQKEVSGIASRWSLRVDKSNGRRVDNLANDMHENYVAEITSQMLDGTLKVTA